MIHSREMVPHRARWRKKNNKNDDEMLRLNRKTDDFYFSFLISFFSMNSMETRRKNHNNDNIKINLILVAIFINDKFMNKKIRRSDKHRQLWERNRSSWLFFYPEPFCISCWRCMVRIMNVIRFHVYHNAAPTTTSFSKRTRIAMIVIKQIPSHTNKLFIFHSDLFVCSGLWPTVVHCVSVHWHRSKSANLYIMFYNKCDDNPFSRTNAAESITQGFVSFWNCRTPLRTN